MVIVLHLCVCVCVCVYVCMCVCVSDTGRCAEDLPRCCLPALSQLKETTNINKSLVCLGNVISSLSQRGAHVNYRDSKLTKLLKNSIGGDSQTLMIACISPAPQNYEESLSTMRFACRAKRVQNRARKVTDPRDALIVALQVHTCWRLSKLNGTHVDLMLLLLLLLHV